MVSYSSLAEAEEAGNNLLEEESLSKHFTCCPARKSGENSWIVWFKAKDRNLEIEVKMRSKRRFVAYTRTPPSNGPCLEGFADENTLYHAIDYAIDDLCANIKAYALNQVDAVIESFNKFEDAD